MARGAGVAVNVRIRALVPPVTTDGGRWSDGAEVTMARRFVDARGTEWEVWEVGARRTLADASPAGGQGWSGGGGGGGAAGASSLRFESATQRRRLGRYPAWWEALSAPELSALCAAATPEPPPPARAVVLDLLDAP